MERRASIIQKTSRQFSQFRLNPAIALGFLVLVSIFLILAASIYQPLPDAPLWQFIESEKLPPDFPLVRRFEGGGTISMLAELPSTEGMSLCIPWLDAAAVAVWLDGQPLVSLGDGAGLGWEASLLVIPLPGAAAGDGLLRLEITGERLIAIPQPPFLENRPQAVRRLKLHRFLYRDVVVFFMGCAILVGVLMVGFSLRRNQPDSLFLGFSCLLLTAFAAEFHLPALAMPEGYGLPRRLLIALGFLGAAAFLAGFGRHYSKRFTANQWAAIPMAVCAVLCFAAPSSPVLNTWMPPMYAAAMVCPILMTAGIAGKQRDFSSVPVMALILALIFLQTAISRFFHLPMPPAAPYASVVASTLLGFQLLQDMHKIRRERDDLRQAYNRDPLTDAYNRRALNDAALEEYAAAVFMDLDSFKRYNDKYGHEKGDALLRRFVAQTRLLLRRNDLIIRYGGDEFLILLKEASGESVTAIVQRIRESLHDLVTDREVDLSYGTAVIGKEGVLDLSELDKGMYDMKQRKKRGQQISRSGKENTESS